MTSQQPFRSIQYLRAAAALMIVFYHLGLPLSRAGHVGPWPDGLAHGVDLFFVISGFIMVVATQDGRVSAHLSLLCPFLRIAPLYFSMTAVLLLLVAARKPGLVQSFRFEWPHVLASFAFWPMTNPATGETTPVLIPGWTLQYEMFLYLLFAIAMLAGRWSLAVLGAMFLALVAVGPAFAFGTALTFFTAPLILQFLMGVLLGRAFQSSQLLRPPLGPLDSVTLGVATTLAALTLIAAPVLLPPPWEPIQSGFCATLLVARAGAAGGKRADAGMALDDPGRRCQLRDLPGAPCRALRHMAGLAHGRVAGQPLDFGAELRLRFAGSRAFPACGGGIAAAPAASAAHSAHPRFMFQRSSIA